MWLIARNRSAIKWPEFRLCIRELTGTPFYPGGSAIIDVLEKLNPAVQTYVQDIAPDGWYTDISQVYAKALNWEYKRQAAVQVVQRDQQASTFSGRCFCRAASAQCKFR